MRVQIPQPHNLEEDAPMNKSERRELEAYAAELMQLLASDEITGKSLSERMSELANAYAEYSKFKLNNDDAIITTNSKVRIALLAPLSKLASQDSVTIELNVIEAIIVTTLLAQFANAGLVPKLLEFTLANKTMSDVQVAKVVEMLHLAMSVSRFTDTVTDRLNEIVKGG